MTNTDTLSMLGRVGKLMPPMTIGEMAEISLENIQYEADRILAEADELQGVMIITADEKGVGTVGHVHPDCDSRLMSLWMLGAMMSHVADSAEADMHPFEAAQWAVEVMNDYDPDVTVEDLDV